MLTARLGLWFLVVAPTRIQARKDDSIRGRAAGVKRSRDTAFIDADALPLSEQFASLYMQRSHGTMEAEPTMGQGRSLGIYSNDDKQPAGRI